MYSQAESDTVELMYDTGWTDGLPVVTPTRDRVRQFTDYLELSPDELIAELPPLGGRATVERIAVNAVMAGCMPEYMPVVIAALRALMDDRFNLRGVQCSTGLHSPLLIVNGPIVAVPTIKGINIPVARVITFFNNFFYLNKSRRYQCSSVWNLSEELCFINLFPFYGM